MSQPRAVLQHSDPGRGQEAHFGGELAALFAAILKLARKLPVEEHHRLAHSDTVFCAAKAEHIHARLPGDFLGFRAKSHESVRKPSAIHLYSEIELPGGIC